MTSWKFWKHSLERAIKSAGQTLVLMWGVGQFNVLDVNWLQVVGLAAGAAVLSLVTSVASAPVGEGQSPNATTEP